MRIALGAVVACAVVLGAGCRGKKPPAGFVRISAGSFEMGDDEDPNEGPVHSVTLSHDFFLQVHEVTRGEFRAALGSVPGPWTPSCDDSCPVVRINRVEAMAYANARSRAEKLPECYDLVGARGRIGGGCRPDEFGCGPGISGSDWDERGYEVDTVGFAGLSCKGYRLPTEAEWEYAALAGRSAADARADLDGQAWYDDNSSRIQAVGKKSANPWGLHDMLGNVWEMTEDRMGPYPPERQTDPTGPASGDGYVYRGGSYVNGAARTTATARLVGGLADRNANCGFRLARTAP